MRGRLLAMDRSDRTDNEWEAGNEAKEKTTVHWGRLSQKPPLSAKDNKQRFTNQNSEWNCNFGFRCVDRRQHSPCTSLLRTLELIYCIRGVRRLSIPSLLSSAPAPLSIRYRSILHASLKLRFRYYGRWCSKSFPVQQRSGADSPIRVNKTRLSLYTLWKQI